MNATHPIALIDLASRMRVAQRRHSRTKSIQDLQVANDLERRVDDLLNQIKVSGAPSLFDGRVMLTQRECFLLAVAIHSAAELIPGTSVDCRQDLAVLGKLGVFSADKAVVESLSPPERGRVVEALLSLARQHDVAFAAELKMIAMKLGLGTLEDHHVQS